MRYPKEHPTLKRWYLIPGYRGYVANRKGEIRNLKTNRVTMGGFAGRYRRVSVYKTGAKTPTLAYSHDLICRAFYGPPRGAVVVKHLDNNPGNTAPSNLAWGTQSDNIQQVYDDGLLPSKEALSLQW